QGEDKAIKNLERAKEKLQIVQEKVSLDTSEEIKTNVDEIIDKLNEEENLPEEFDEYILEEEKTQLTAVLTEKTYEYCSELAKEDFVLMLKDEECNPETAPEPLKDDLAKLKDLQERMFVQLMLEIRSCIDDPGTCNCEVNVDIDQKAKCEKMVALALKCEYKDDEVACDELESMKPKQGDNFAESFVPGFLRNLFKEKSYMVEYDIEPSDCVPEECWDNNDKPECKQYDKFKETKEDWDEYGNFIGTRDKCGKEGQTPTMKESIPQCFDGDVFLEEKCGKITMVENEEGLINYIIENEINGILGGFENNSENNTIDVNGSDGQMQVENKVREIKEEMNQINNQIKDITYAAGTGPGGDSGVVIDGDGQDVATDDGGGNNVVDNDVAGDGDGGYAPRTSADSPGNDVVIDGGDNVVVTDDVTVDSGTVDNGGGDEGSSNDVAGVDEGSGEPGVVDED
ncbi:MAG: hypothetical protein KKB31_01030, partial [Nanoarchaeota archaeon]|nr:hypothetical protein [Nanoarchaeota archaeon]